MLSAASRRIAARFVFFGGLLFMLLGTAFLLGTINGISGISVMASFLVVIIGALSAFLALKLNKRSLYLFFATFFIQVGFFLFLSAIQIIPIPFYRWWPLTSIFAGLALLPTCWHRHGSIRAGYLVPAVSFVILGAVLLIFSLDVVSFSFRQFILQWWPLLVVLAGLILVLISLGTKIKGEDAKS